MAEEDDEFERIARANKDLQDIDWAKVRVFEFDGLSARMPYETYRGYVEGVKRGMLHHRLTVRQAVAGIENLEWPIQVHVVRFAGEEFSNLVATELPTTEYPLMAARFNELQDYLVEVMDRRPNRDSQ